MHDISSSAAWSSSLSGVATVTGSGLALSAAQGSTTIKAAVGPVSGSALLTVTARALTSISISPATSSIPLGRLQQFNAIGTFTDGATQDLSNSAVWSSSSPSMATVTPFGLAV